MTAGGNEYWRCRHQESGKQLPEVIASSLSKSLFYASVNAIDMILDGIQLKRNENESRRPAKRVRVGRSRLSKNASILLDYLMTHHKREEGPVFEDLSQDEVGKQFGWNQSRVSKAFKALFADDAKKTGKRPMEYYQDLCVTKRIDSYLTYLHTKYFEPALRKTIYFGDLSRLAQSDPEDDSTSDDADE